MAGAVGLAVLVGAAGCGSSDVQALPPPASTDADLEAGQAGSTTSTPTTVTTASSTETTLSDRAEAEAAIEAAIEGWWTTPRDTSLGDDGLPIEFATGPLLRRIREVAQQTTDAGQIMRTRGTAEVRILGLRVDLDEGTAELDTCTLGDGEMIDAETGEVIAVDGDQAYEGTAFAERVDGEWKVSDFFTTRETDDPVECDTGPA